MASDSISFFCPACGIKLTVPSSLAGVVGPCPSCRTQIQAPIPAPPMPSAPPAAYVNPPIPLAPPPPVIPEPPIVPPPQAALPVVSPQPTSLPAPASTASGQPVVLKPEPRNLPNRPHPEVIAKPIPESSKQGDSRVPPAAPLPRHPHRSSILARVGMLLVFLIAAAALVIGVHHLLTVDRNGGSEVVKSTPPAAAGPKATEPPVTPQQPAAPPAPASTPAAPDPAVSLPAPPPDQTPVADPPTPAPEPPDPAAPGVEAMEVLEKFLAAKSLPERLPLIETRSSEAELANSCLSSPLPPAPVIVPEFQETNGIENLVDFYYTVNFEKGSTPIEKLTVLVRSRGSGEPKVVVDPFLDLFGGRLAAYIANPTDKAAVFHVIANPVATCLDKGKPIPDRDKKFTLKLLPSENAKEIALAYFGKASEIGELLRDGSRGLGLGKAKACTVMLSWNLNKDDPANPFLEAIQLKALDWNP